jgi:hypothetical protein
VPARLRCTGALVPDSHFNSGVGYRLLATHKAVLTAGEHHAMNIGCNRCTYGRRSDLRCDIHGIAATSGTICRSYREPGQSHGNARKTHSLLVKLHPGVVYSIVQDTAGRSQIQASFLVTPVVRTEPSSDVGDVLSESHECLVRNIDDTTSPARIDCYESGLIILLMKDIRYAGREAGNVFEALRQIRLEMEKDGRIPLVNGSNRHAVISGMAIDMGRGYRIYLADPLSNEEWPVVDTFGNAQVTDPVFVDAQEAFKRDMFSKMGGNQSD